MNRQVLLLILGGVFSAALGQALFKVGASGQTVWTGFLNVWIMGGLVLYGVGTVLWIYSLSKADLIVVYPFTALSFVLVYVIGVLVLGEKTSARALAGISLVLFGLYLIWTGE